MRKHLLAALLSLLGLLFPAELRAQDIGNVGLRTVSATVANGATCTGAAQNFTTAQGITNFRNIGQTSHLATATSNASQFQMEIDGIDNVGNVYRLSDLQLGIPTSAKGGLVVTASGYMTTVQISVTCTAASTFTIAYTGSFSPTPPNIAGPLLASIDKLPFQTAAANTSASTTFQTPTGNSQGTIIFQYAAGGPTGSTISVQCISNAGGNLQLYTFTAATPNTAQLFQIGSSTCPFVTLSYTSGGASATTYNLEYAFTVSGTTSAISDPCQSASTRKQSAPFTISTATTTQVVGLVAGQTIYPCGIALVANTDSSSIETFQWEYGTGASCGTGTTVLSGPMKDNSANGSVTQAFNGATFMNIPVGNALCVVTVQTSGAVINLNGVLSYVQQ